MSASEWMTLSLTQRVTFLINRPTNQDTLQSLQLDPQRITAFWKERVNEDSFITHRISRGPDPREVVLTQASTVLSNWEMADSFVSDLARAKILLEEKHICLINLKLCNTLESTPGVYRNEDLYSGTNLLNQMIPYKDVPHQMLKFITWLQERMGQCDRGEQNPVYIASKTLEWLLAISPFIDGNHRTAKAVMDYVLQTYGFPPARLFTYIQSLSGSRAADQNPSPEYICRLVKHGVESSCTQLKLPSPFLNVENKF